jgi:hypothetical protein
MNQDISQHLHVAYSKLAHPTVKELKQNKNQ